MQVFWLFYWFIFFLYNIIDILLRIKIFFTKKTMEIYWHMYVDYV